MATAQQLASLLDDDDDDLVSEMSMDEFQKELNKYPKIRDENAQIPIELELPEEVCDNIFTIV
jgi:hypothetical protein